MRLHIPWMLLLLHRQQTTNAFVVRSPLLQHRQTSLFSTLEERKEHVAAATSLAASTSDGGGPSSRLATKRNKPLRTPQRGAAPQKEPVWAYSFLGEGSKERDEVLESTLQSEQTYLSSCPDADEAKLAWFDNGMAILIQWAKLGEAQKAQDLYETMAQKAGLLSVSSEELPPSNADRLVKALRRSLHAHINQAKRYSWCHVTRRPVYSFSTPYQQEQLEKAQEALVAADKILLKMERYSARYVEASSTFEASDVVKTIPAAIVDGTDYYELLEGFCQTDLVVPALRCIGRLEGLFSSNQYLPRLAPSTTLYVRLMNTVMKGSVSTGTSAQRQNFFERMGSRCKPTETVHSLGMRCLQLGEDSKVYPTLTPTISLYNTMFESWSKRLPAFKRKAPIFKNDDVLELQAQCTREVKRLWQRMEETTKEVKVKVGKSKKESKEGEEQEDEQPVFKYRKDRIVYPTAKSYTEMMYTYIKADRPLEAVTMAEELTEILLEKTATSSQLPKGRIDFRPFRHLVNLLGRDAEHYSHTQGISEEKQAADGTANTFEPESYARQASKVAQCWRNLEDVGFRDNMVNSLELGRIVMNAWADAKSSESAMEAQSVFDELQKRDGLVLDTAAYNALLKAIRSDPGAQATAVSKIEALLEEMNDSGREESKPDGTSFNHLLQACANDADNDENIAKAEEALTFLEESGKAQLLPTGRSYQTLMEAYISRGELTRAEDLFDRMEQKSALVPTPAMYEDMILRWCDEPPSNESASQHAQSLLARMHDHHQGLMPGQEKESYKPKLSLYNAVVDASSERYDDAEADAALAVAQLRDEVYQEDPKATESMFLANNKEAFKLLDMIDGPLPERDEIYASTYNFNWMIGKIANSGKSGAGRRAEDLLDYMLDLHLKRGHKKVCPDISSFNAVIGGWARSGDPDAGDRAAAVLDKLTKIQEEGLGLVHVEPDRITYNSIMNAYARSKNPEKAAAWYEKLDELYTKTGNKRFIPDMFSYLALLDAQSHRNSPERTEQILLKLSNACKEDPKRTKPTTACFNKVLRAWAVSGAHDSFDRAEGILSLMEDMVYESVGPSTKSYNLALLAIANSRAEDSANLAFELLERMEANNCKPDAVTYTTAMNAMVGLGGPEALAAIRKLKEDAYASAARLDAPFFSGMIAAVSKIIAKDGTEFADEVVQDLKQKGDLIGVDIDTNVYNSLIKCWAKSGKRSSASRALEILDEMKAGEASGRRRVKPNAMTFTSVIECFAKCGDPTVASQAESILNGAMGDVRPTVHTYTTVIQAYSRSDLPDKAQRSKAVFDRLKEEYETVKDKNLRPTIAAYNALLNSCEFTDGDVDDGEEAFRLAVSVLEEMRKAPDLSMDHVSYGAFFGVISELMPESLVRDQLVRLIFNQCIKAGQLGPVTRKKLREAAGSGLFRVLMEGRDKEELPLEWSENVKGR